MAFLIRAVLLAAAAWPARGQLLSAEPPPLPSDCYSLDVRMDLDPYLERLARCRRHYDLLALDSESRITDGALGYDQAVSSSAENAALQLEGAAERLEAGGRTEEAGQAARRAAELRAVAAATSDDPRRIRENAERAERGLPEDSDFAWLPALAQGREASRRGEHGEAERQLTRAIELNSEAAPAYLHRAVARLARNDLAGARSDAERAKRLAPSLPLANAVLATVREGRSGPAEARRLAWESFEDRSAAAKPDAREAVEVRGPRARRLREGGKRSPEEAASDELVAEAETALNVGNADAALAAARRAAKADPANPSAYLAQAMAFSGKGDHRGAAAAATEAMEKGAGPEARAVRAHAALEQGDAAAAARDAEQLIQEAPEDATGHALKAAALERLGDMDGAAEAWERASELDPDYDLRSRPAAAGGAIRNIKKALLAMSILATAEDADPEARARALGLRSSAEGARVLADAPGFEGNGGELRLQYHPLTEDLAGLTGRLPSKGARIVINSGLKGSPSEKYWYLHELHHAASMREGRYGAMAMEYAAHLSAVRAFVEDHPEFLRGFDALKVEGTKDYWLAHIYFHARVWADRLIQRVGDYSNNPLEVECQGLFERGVLPKRSGLCGNLAKMILRTCQPDAPCGGTRGLTFVVDEAYENSGEDRRFDAPTKAYLNADFDRDLEYRRRKGYRLEER